MARGKKGAEQSTQKEWGDPVFPEWLKYCDDLAKKYREAGDRKAKAAAETLKRKVENFIYDFENGVNALTIQEFYERLYQEGLAIGTTHQEPSQPTEEKIDDLVSEYEREKELLNEAEGEGRLAEKLMRDHKYLGRVTEAEALAVYDQLMALRSRDMDNLGTEQDDFTLFNFKKALKAIRAKKGPETLDQPEEKPFGKAVKEYAAVKQAEESERLAAEKQEREKAKAAMKELLAGLDVRRVVIHGGQSFYQNGNPYTTPKADIDARLGVKLLADAGIEWGQTDFVEKGTSAPGKKDGMAINVDTGGKPGITFDERSNTLYIDHHQQEKGVPTSASQLTYELLTELKKPDGSPYLERTPGMDRLIKFVTEIDNVTFKIDREFLEKNYSKSLYSCYEKIPISTVVNLFKDPSFDPRQPLELPEVAALQEKNQGLVEESLKAAEETLAAREDEGITHTSKALGEVLLQTGNDGGIRLNKLATAKGVGCDTYVSWDEKQGNIYITSEKYDLEPVYKKLAKVFPHLMLIRGSMIMVEKGKKQKAELAKTMAGQFETFIKTIGLEKTIPKKQVEAEKEAALKEDIKRIMGEYEKVKRERKLAETAERRTPPQSSPETASMRDRIRAREMGDDRTPIGNLFAYLGKKLSGIKDFFRIEKADIDGTYNGYNYEILGRKSSAEIKPDDIKPEPKAKPTEKEKPHYGKVFPRGENRPAGEEKLKDQSPTPPENPEKLRENIIKQYLAYQDTDFTPEIKGRILDQTLHSLSAKKYADSIQKLLTEKSTGDLTNMAAKMLEEMLAKAKSLGIDVSSYGKSASWVMWDIGKQYYFFTHQNENDPKYKIGHPLTSDEKRAEIINRHLGWEAYSEYHRSGSSWKQDIDNKPEFSKALSLLNKTPKEGGELSSIDLAELGKLLREIK